MKTRTALIVAAGLTGALAGLLAWTYPTLPDRIPTHWDIHGNVDGWMAKRTVAWVVPSIMAGLVLFTAAAQWLSPRHFEVEPFRRTFNVVMVIMIALVGYLGVVGVWAASHPGAASGRLVVAGMLGALALIGNLLGKVRRNFWLGIRTPWTLASDRVWVATHRLGAWLLTAAGVIGAAATLMGAPLAVVLGGVMAAALAPVVYSLVLYKRLQARGVLAVAGIAAIVGLGGVGAAPCLAAGPTPSEVMFDGVGGLKLRGTLLLPEIKEGQRVPAAVLLPGSGPPDRDGNVPPMLMTDLLKQIAERLAEEGIATLRYDKRSVMKYMGEWPMSDLDAMNEFFAWDKFVGDARAAQAFLRADPRVDPERVAFIGHSEGGLISLQIAHDTAGTDDAPAAVVLLATAGRPLDEVVRNQIADLLERQAPPEDVKKELLAQTERAIEQVKREGSVPMDLHPGLRPIFNPTAAKLLQSYFTIDPIDLAAKYEGPVLIVQGELDSQVLAAKDTPRLEEALKARSKGSVETLVAPNASHNLKHVEKKEEPGFTGEVVAPAMDKIATWLRTTLGDRSHRR